MSRNQQDIVERESFLLDAAVGGGVGHGRQDLSDSENARSRAPFRGVPRCGRTWTGSDFVLSMEEDIRTPGERQRRLSAALVGCNRAIAGKLVHDPVVASHCTVCRCCAAVCPTEALSRVKENGVRRLVVDADSCTGCGACADFCPEDAIRVAEQRVPGPIPAHC